MSETAKKKAHEVPAAAESGVNNMSDDDLLFFPETTDRYPEITSTVSRAYTALKAQAEGFGAVIKAEVIAKVLKHEGDKKYIAAVRNHITKVYVKTGKLIGSKGRSGGGYKVAPAKKSA